MKLRIIVSLIVLCASSLHGQMLQGINNASHTSSGACQNWTILDWSGGTNGVQPNSTTLGTSTFNKPSGFSVTVSDASSTMTYATVAVKSPLF